MDKSLTSEIKKMVLGVAILGVCMAIVVGCIWHWQAPMLWGILLGCSYAILNFVLTAYFISRSVQKSENQAKGYMMGGYYLRLALAAVTIYWAIKAPYFNVFTAAIPLLFPRIVITVCGIAAHFKKDRGERQE